VSRLDPQKKWTKPRGPVSSVRAIINGTTGTVTATTAYDAWGNPETTGGLTSYTPFGFASAYIDPTGLSYLINRYYGPEVGQFVNTDPLVDRTEAPYAYAAGDPVTNQDPLGASCFGSLTSFGHCAGGAAAATTGFVEDHPAVLVIALGVTAVATGGASIVVLGATDATLIGGSLAATSLAAGGVAALVDGGACVDNPGLNSQCVAAGLGATGVLMSVPEFAVGVGVIAEPPFQEYLALQAASVFVSAGGTTVDLAKQLYDQAFQSSSAGGCR